MAVVVVVVKGGGGRTTFDDAIRTLVEGGGENRGGWVKSRVDSGGGARVDSGSGPLLRGGFKTLKGAILTGTGAEVSLGLLVLDPSGGGGRGFMPHFGKLDLHHTK